MTSRSRGIGFLLAWAATIALAAAIAVGLGACGESRTIGAPTTTTITHGGTVTVVGKPDNEGTPAIDGDDETVVDFGHVADAGAAGPVSAFVRRYMQLAASGAAAPVCRLTARRQLPHSFFPNLFLLHEIPWQVIRGSCRRYVAHLLRSQHAVLATELAKLTFARVRIGEEHDSSALAFLRFGNQVEWVFALQRAHHGWTAGTLVPSILP